MELHEVKKQFAKKFGKEFVERAEKDEDRLVNERVAHKLSIRPVRPKREGGREKGRGKERMERETDFSKFSRDYVGVPPSDPLASSGLCPKSVHPSPSFHSFFPPSSHNSPPPPSSRSIFARSRSKMMLNGLLSSILAT